MSEITDLTQDVVNEALFKYKPEGLLVAWLNDGKWVVIDTEDQSVCLVTVEEAEIVPIAAKSVIDSIEVVIP